MMYHVGFTGTRVGMTEHQEAELITFLTKFRTEHEHLVFHYGQAIGADEQAAAIAKSLGYRLISHPSDRPDQQSLRDDLNDEKRDPKPPLDRNRDIVDESQTMLATPETPHEVIRSGTWATIRYAKKRNVHVDKIDP